MTKSFVIEPTPEGHGGTMSRVRRSVLLALAICAALGGTSRASTVGSIHPSFLPDRLGTSTAFTLAIRLASDQGEVPAPVDRAVLHLPAGLGIDLRGAGVCSKARLQASGASGCPARSRIGRGHAVLEVHAGSQTIPEPASLSAFRGPTQAGKPTLEIIGQGETPLYERTVIVGVLHPDRPPFGLKLELAIPPIPTLPGEPNASMLEFSLTIGAGRSPRAHLAGAIVVPRRCPAGGFPFAADFAFEDGSSASASATAPCP